MYINYDIFLMLKDGDKTNLKEKYIRFVHLCIPHRTGDTNFQISKASEWSFYKHTSNNPYAIKVLFRIFYPTQKLKPHL